MAIKFLLKCFFQLNIQKSVLRWKEDFNQNGQMAAGLILKSD